MEPVVRQPRVSLLDRKHLSIFVTEPELRGILESVAVSMAIPFHIGGTANHTLEDVRVIVTKLDMLLQVDGVISSNPDVSEALVHLAELKLLIHDLDAHARYVVVVPDVFLALGPRRTKEPRMVQLMVRLEYSVQVKLRRDVHASS